MKEVLFHWHHSFPLYFAYQKSMCDIWSGGSHIVTLRQQAWERNQYLEVYNYTDWVLAELLWNCLPLSFFNKWDDLAGCFCHSLCHKNAFPQQESGMCGSYASTTGEHGEYTPFIHPIRDMSITQLNKRHCSRSGEIKSASRREVQGYLDTLSYKQAGLGNPYIYRNRQRVYRARYTGQGNVTNTYQW